MFEILMRAIRNLILGRYPAKKRFEKFLADRQVTVTTARPLAGMQAMVDFYRSVRVPGCELDKSGDMLLYQWGTYDWGHGNWFELDLTRQFMFGDSEDENIWQLSLTYRFRPTPTLTAIGKSNRWCHLPDELHEFWSFVSTSDAMSAVGNQTANSVELSYFNAG